MLGTTLYFIAKDQEDLSSFTKVYQQILRLHQAGINVHIALKTTEAFKRFIDSEESTINSENVLEVFVEQYAILKSLKIHKIPFINIGIDNQAYEQVNKQAVSEETTLIKPEKLKIEFIARKIINLITQINKTGGVIFVFDVQLNDAQVKISNIINQYFTKNPIKLLYLDMTRDRYKTECPEFYEIITELFEQHKIQPTVNVNVKEALSHTELVPKKIQSFPCLTSPNQVVQRYKPKYYCNSVAFSLYRTKNFGSVKIAFESELVKLPKGLPKIKELSLLQRSLRLLCNS